MYSFNKMSTAPSVAAGFNAVCDRVAFFREQDMVVPPKEKQGGKKQISPEQVHDILTHAPPPQDGRFRVKASLLAEGEPVAGRLHDE